jgi:hypothetical protein
LTIDGAVVALETLRHSWRTPGQRVVMSDVLQLRAFFVSVGAGNMSGGYGNEPNYPSWVVHEWLEMLKWHARRVWMRCWRKTS